MRKRLVKSLSLVGLVAALGISSIPVQAASVRFRVPFTFTVNGAALPPGTYTASSAQSAVWVCGASKSAVVLTNHLESRTDLDAKLIFDKYGDQYVLREVWMGGGIGRKLPKPRLNQELVGAMRGVDPVASVEQVVISASY